MNVILKPIFHQACFGHIGTANTLDFVLGTFQIFCSPPKDYISKRG